MITLHNRHRTVLALFVILIPLMACSFAGSTTFEGPLPTPTYPPIAVTTTPTLPPIVTPVPTPTCTVSEKFGSRVLQWCPQIMAAVKTYPEIQPNWLAAIVFYGSKGENQIPTQGNSAVGLMQVMPSDRIDDYLKPYFADCTPGEQPSQKPYDFKCRPTTQVLLDAYVNLDYGSALLSAKLKDNNNDLRRALIAYGGSSEYADRVLEVLKQNAP